MEIQLNDYHKKVNAQKEGTEKVKSTFRLKVNDG